MIIKMGPLPWPDPAFADNREASIDTETYGLFMYPGQACKEEGDKLFSVIISDDNGDRYFNYHDYGDHTIPVLPRDSLQLLKPLLDDETRVWFLQNAKYDLKILAQDGLFIAGKIYDLSFLDRIHFNQHMRYNLDVISKRWGEEKFDTVKNHIEENKLVFKVNVPHLNKEYDRHPFHQVPFHIIAPYGLQDGRGTLNTGRKILAAIRDEDDKNPHYVAKQMNVVENEARLVHTLFRMEHLGIKIDRSYCEQARMYYENLCEQAKYHFKRLTGEDFVKGTTVFEKVFESERDKWVQTDKGNWVWDAKQLSKFENPAARYGIDYAEAKKQLEYFQNFLFYADSGDVIHPDFMQAGTATGRLSCRDPNLQNLTNPDKYGDEDEKDSAKFPVRRSFVPREGFFFAMLDYDQIEFRFFLDLAEANGLIDEILKGLDVHQATANVAGVSRKYAKTINFLTLYGGGIAKMCLGMFKPLCSPQELGVLSRHLNPWARRHMTDEDRKLLSGLPGEKIEHDTPLLAKTKEIQESIFKAAPEIKRKIKEISDRAAGRGYIFNWLGRRYQFTEKKFAYKAPNHLVQGGCADILKLAMNRCDALLMNYKSKLVCTIHDELIFEIAFGEESVVPQLKQIMESVYAYRRLPLTVDVEFSFTNLADKSSWASFNEFSEKARNKVQGESPPAAEATT